MKWSLTKLFFGVVLGAVFNWARNDVRWTQEQSPTPTSIHRECSFAIFGVTAALLVTAIIDLVIGGSRR